MGCHQHHAGASGKDASGEGTYRFEKIVFINEPGDGGRFAAGNGKGIALRKVSGAPDFKNFG
jgi:hypothetical protein